MCGGMQNLVFSKHACILTDSYNKICDAHTLMDVVTSSIKTSPRNNHPEQPAQKRTRCEAAGAAGAAGMAAPMQLSNGNGMAHEEDRIGPRKLIPRYA